MASIRIEGGYKLSGEIKVDGAKNSVVALIPAAILCNGRVEFTNVPDISDIYSLRDILVSLGVSVEFGEHKFIMDSSNMFNAVIPCDLSSKLRASYYFMGSLLGKYNKVNMCFPGGCSIGARPIDLHLKGFEALGAKVTNEGNKYIVEAEDLKGANILSAMSMFKDVVPLVEFHHERYDGKGYSQGDPVSCGQAMYNFAKAIETARKSSVYDTSKWEVFLRKACDAASARILSEGWNPKSTAEGFYIAPLAISSKLFKNKKIMDM